MAELPSDVIFDILSRLPVKSLARFRCVSKPWCAYIDDDYVSILHGERAVEELTPIMYETNLSRITCFNIIKPEAGTTLEANKGLSLESGSTCSKYFFEGSCNGLLYLSLTGIPFITSLTVIHPLRKEFYKLPPIKRRLDGPYYRIKLSCGIGFDVSTNTFKMVCILSRRAFSSTKTFDSISKNLCTLVHVLGMNIHSSWREISQVPPYPTSGDGVSTHGCLYWQSSSGEQLICFDVRTEEFTLIYPPKRSGRCYLVNFDLIDLQGEVGYAYYYSDNIIEVWVLKQKLWVKHCQLSINTPTLHGNVKVLGRWNKYGDLLVKSYVDGRNNLFVYSLKSGVLDVVNIVGPVYDYYDHMFMYPASSTFSIRGINKIANSLKTDLNAG